METFTIENEITERSLRRRAANKGCRLQRTGVEYTLMWGRDFMVRGTDDEIWSIIDSM